VARMANTFYDKQIKNRNFLSPSGFQFNLAKTPKVDFFSQSARIPGIQLGEIMVGNYLKAVPVPGDQIQFEDLTLEFIVDENLENFLEIHSWIYGLGYPDSVSQFESIVIDRETSEIDNLKQFSDGTLTVLNSNFNPMAYIKFKDMFPVSLSTLEFTASENDYTYFTATVTFKYLLYEILDTKFKVRTTSLTKP
tara:strand:+ start:1240 stop:1821 length:582 start_codon:yes stop_codon:yes gene_type:complete